MSIVTSPLFLINSVCLSNQLTQEDIYDLDLGTENGKESESREVVSSLASDHIHSKQFQCVVSCKEGMADIFEKARVKVVFEEDQRGFVRALTCMALSTFRCMEYGRSFFLRNKPSLSSLSYPNLMTFTLFWLGESIANIALVYKTSRVGSYEVSELAYRMMLVAEHCVVWTHLCGSVIDIANACLIFREAGKQGQNTIVSVSIALMILSSVSLLNELAYFAGHVFTKAKQMCASKTFTGSFFSTGEISRLSDEPVKQELAKSSVSKVYSIFGFVSLGIAAVTIVGSSVYRQVDLVSPCEDIIEDMILAVRILITCLAFVILFGYVKRRSP